MISTYAISDQPVGRVRRYHARLADVHGDAARRASERVGGARAVDGDLEVVGAAEQRAQLAGRRVGVGRHDAATGAAADANRRAAPPRRAARTACDRCW